ncbi:VOC family protein [Janthinobacterium fluminis]|uniref:VOC family protein n=1 Tax=Janthinobacterium fluminis TaxID=2987524 RepID=A0ABT5K465_9BURK|nr:VOC family protein [Janthinobacterium fluminis]MDC8759546.1 VOC family protein [Janthinobacterium fluminis]
MAKVLGVGGIFFKSKDPNGLLAWYQQHLGLPRESSDYANFFPKMMPQGGCTVFSPFEDATTYFSPSESGFMFNLVVDDLDGALRQVRLAGAELVGKIASYEYGRFGWFLDPDGNKVELWEPSASE